ncbi:hypothetical protein CONPUDRAFT_75600 [Coniophora puteana RWD-64-598 SS2]|uniref:Uncharacterized protein n=1 Tax=Coniophora puteana (strain RWD-64-598) TaxID=741705 RepID=A0A5M3MEW4_CONPW|nr:uncharacterized protein CONPUDRAFT_75600 [Coniophora puteana RWD-64-598 SS2]EIW77809.1 hypothetical protein CONPUDRAFT_75600 [Coniophora puteana RWD-64-598 SS2]
MAPPPIAEGVGRLGTDRKAGAHAGDCVESGWWWPEDNKAKKIVWVEANIAIMYKRIGRLLTNGWWALGMVTALWMLVTIVWRSAEAMGVGERDEVQEVPWSRAWARDYGLGMETAVRGKEPGLGASAQMDMFYMGVTRECSQLASMDPDALVPMKAKALPVPFWAAWVAWLLLADIQSCKSSISTILNTSGTNSKSRREKIIKELIVIVCLFYLRKAKDWMYHVAKRVKLHGHKFHPVRELTVKEDLAQMTKLKLE